MKIPYLTFQRDRYWKKWVLGVGIWKPGIGCVSWKELWRI
jgi:hypothetical protein